MVVTARSPIERLNEYKVRRGFANLSIISDESGEYTRTYVNPEDADVPGLSVFNRRDGQDPRGGPDPDPLWLMLDWTPEGRGTDWYPKLNNKDE